MCKDTTATEQTAAAPLCPVCARPLPAKKGTGRGRTKEVHKTCSILRSRMNEMETMLRSMEFGDAAAVKMMRGNLFAMMNVTLRADVVKINPDNDEDI